MSLCSPGKPPVGVAPGARPPPLIGSGLVMSNTVPGSNIFPDGGAVAVNESIGLPQPCADGAGALGAPSRPPDGVGAGVAPSRPPAGVGVAVVVDIACAIALACATWSMMSATVASSSLLSLPPRLLGVGAGVRLPLSSGPNMLLPGGAPSRNPGTPPLNKVPMATLEASPACCPPAMP